MKIRFAFFSALIVAAVALVAAENKPAAPTEAEFIAKARAEYPLKTCVVTDEALSPEALDFVYRVEGKPDRLIRFCCDGCLDDFKADPAKFLKKIDDAAKGGSVPAAKKKS